MSSVIDAIRSGKINPSNAFDIIAHVTKAARGDTEAALQAIDDLAKGPDGVLGTADDIPPATIATLRALVDSGIVRQAVSHVAKTTQKGCCF